MTVSSQLTGTQSNLPTIQRFDAGDYKEAPPWFVNKFLQAMNLFVQPVYNILNQGVGISENTTDEIYTFTFAATSSTGSANTFSFAPRKFVGRPNGVIVGQCYDASVAVPTAIGNPVTIDWYWTGSMVSLLAIYGLTSGHSYNFTLRIF